MISVLLYGRNDSHGYNLHKRAAISLNCIAHVLDHADDEIIFVDYNTPDDMPTFVEAIQDTLTEKARRLIRVLRIRPEIHERFKHKTHLVALESVSRNAAARRANPANRWLLSTNTDMVFVPRNASRSLSEIVGTLEDGFYHLPRFELPECLWESLNRLDPESIVDAARDWGVRFHLNDVVYMNDTVIYDGPGDFQLVLRDDLFAIHGFHEEMLRGWHVDSNFAKRMKLFRGDVKSALPFLYGYHCDHTRQATVLHGRGRVENDMHRFFFDVNQAGVPDQKDNWGLRGENLEELRLSDAPYQPYVRTLEQVLPGGTKPYIESRYSGRGPSDLDYDPEHVLPYLCDLLSTTPRHWNVSYAGCRSYAFELFSAAFAKMGFTGRISVPESFAWLTPSPDLKDRIDRVAFDAWFASGHQFIFEFGLETVDTYRDQARERSSPSWASADRLRLASTALVFQRMLQRERITASVAPRRPRRVLAVNTIVNAFDALICDNLSFTYTPYSSRIRHGYVILGDEKSGAPGKPSAAPDSGQREMPVRKHVEDAKLGAEPSKQLDLHTGSRASSAAAHNDDQSLSRICDVRDWEHEGWLNWARRFIGGQAAHATYQRGQEIWEQASLLHGLDRLGMCAGDKSVLTVERIPAPALIAALGDCRCRSSMVEISTFFSGDGEIFSAGVSERRRLETYDAIVLPHGAMADMGGMVGFPALLKRAAGLLASGGIIAFAAETFVGGASDAVGIDWNLIADNKLMDFIHAYTDLDVLGPLRKSASTTSLGSRDDLAFKKGNGLISTSAWFLRKRSVAREGEWSRFGSALRQHQSGSLMNLLYKMSIGTREPDGIHVSKAEAPGIWVYGPYLKLPSGFYRAVIDCVASDTTVPRAPVVEVDVILGPDHCATVRTLNASDLANGPADIIFEVPSRLGAENDGSYPFEIRLWHKAAANLHLKDIRLTGATSEEAAESVGATTAIFRSILDPVRRWHSEFWRRGAR